MKTSTNDKVTPRTIRRQAATVRRGFLTRHGRTVQLSDDTKRLLEGGGR